VFENMIYMPVIAAEESWHRGTDSSRAFEMRRVFHFAEFGEKFVSARRRNQHAGRVRSPRDRRVTCSHGYAVVQGDLAMLDAFYCGS
jgi:hypothetical protein